MSSSPMRKTYEANCHCASVRYSVTLSDALYPEGQEKVIKCNCSICTKNGYLLVYPKREDVVFHYDSESRLRDYYFGKKYKPHRFCSQCGSSVLIDFKDSDVERQRPLLAVNVRLFRDIDLETANYINFDGKHRLSPEYQI